MARRQQFSDKLRRRALQFMRLLLVAMSSSSAWADPPHLDDRTVYHAPRASLAPVMDGDASDEAWKTAAWQEIKFRWLGPEYTPADFAGRYKVVWTRERIYLLAEIVDDVLIDTHRDPLEQYWDDDTLEIFIDEDYSGGEHQFNHNAFAYHVSLDNRAIDIGTDRKPRDFSHHVRSQWRQYDHMSVWEVAIDLYDDSYIEGSANNQPETLAAGKILGLMVAYCDNDGSEVRENFVGSEFVPSGSKDRGWIDAGLFGKVILSD